MQAKGRVERSFGTAQDRLVKGLRVAGARTLEQANRYLEEEFLPWWNQHLVVRPANAADAHRPLGEEHNLSASLSRVETRQVDNDYTFPLDGKKYRLRSSPMPAGLRGGTLRIEQRLDGSLAARFRDRYLHVEECAIARKAPVALPPKSPSRRRRSVPSEAARASMQNLARSRIPVWRAADIDRTRTPDRFD
jgi:hypothetical protein